MTNAVVLNPETKPAAKKETFTLKDRCDACGSAAYLRASRADLEASLLFCGHHATKYEKTLEDQGFIFSDGRHVLESFANQGPGASNPE